MTSKAASSSEAGGSRTPRAHPLVRGAQSSSSVLVNSCQRGNPVLQHIKGVSWEFADIVPDYQVGVTSGVLFLSLRYHRLHPEYIHTRIQRLAHMYTLRILLVVCDVTDHQQAIRELTKIALIHQMTLMVAWTAEEAGRYLEMYKAFEQKPPDLIRTKVGNSYMSVLQSVLTNVRRVNKTDVLTMSTKYKSFATMVQQTSDQLVMLPGMGDTKAKNLARAFREPFLLQETTAPPKPALPPASKEHRREEPITFDSLPDNFESLPEEEQLRIAMQLSME